MALMTVNAVVVFCNVLFFMSIQSVFFWLVISRQIDSVFASKVQWLRQLRGRLERTGQCAQVQVLDAAIVRGLDGYHPRAESNRVERERENRSLFLRRIAPIIAVTFLILVALITYNLLRGHSFTRAHWFGLGLVVLAYATELLFFAFVVRPYVMMGDSDVLCSTADLCQ